MTQKSKCKFCHREILLCIDDDYGNLGDPFHLLKLAACDRCADLLCDRRRIANAARAIAIRLLRTAEDEQKLREKLRAILVNVMKKWFRVISEWRNNPMIVFDEECVNQIMANPERVGDVLHQCWKVA